MPIWNSPPANNAAWAIRQAISSLRGGARIEAAAFSFAGLRKTIRPESDASLHPPTHRPMSRRVRDLRRLPCQYSNAQGHHKCRIFKQVLKRSDDLRVR